MKNLKTKYKTLALFIAIPAFMLALTLGSCNTPSEKVTNAKEDVVEARAALEKAEADCTSDIEKFRKETDERIVANQKSLNEFNARISKQKKEAQEEYKNKVADLEQKNSDMKKKMDDYKAAGKENWEKFKIEFSHDMSELGKALSGLADKNLR